MNGLPGRPTADEYGAAFAGYVSHAAAPAGGAVVGVTPLTESEPSADRPRCSRT
jgi:hypothetical protein